MTKVPAKSPPAKFIKAVTFTDKAVRLDLTPIPNEDAWEGAELIRRAIDRCADGKMMTTPQFELGIDAGGTWNTEYCVFPLHRRLSRFSYEKLNNMLECFGQYMTDQ